MDKEITFFPENVASKSHWNDPGILKALATGYQKIPEGLVEGYAGPGTKGHPEVALVASDNGEPPSPGHGEKRSLRTPEDLQPPTKMQRQKSPDKPDRCCNCTTISSTCSTSRCKCRKAGNVCMNCICFSKCMNHGDPRLSCVSDEAKEESADSIITPWTLDYKEHKETKRGESNKTNTAEKDTAQFTLAEDPGEKKEEREEPTKSPIGDLPGAAISEADIKLMNVYIHQNDGTYLDGGITNDSVWQA
jgi:hypothetical protein